MVAVVLAGPTAVGKTELGIRLAEEIGGEIISADSRQIYRHMDIGTAKPGKAELARVPHHLIDIISPDETFSAGRFGREARHLLCSIESRGAIPIIVGGSGLYITAAVDGFFEDVDDHPEIRRDLLEQLACDGTQNLYRELEVTDPVTHARLSPRDTRRILRALELARSGSGSRSDRLAQMDSDPLKDMPLMFCLALDRRQLYDRVDLRVERMLDAGWLEEVRRLVALGYGRDAAGMEGIGYHELLKHLIDDTSLAHAVAAIKQRTRRYAKRQLTWFRRDRRLRWLELGRVGQRGAMERVLGHFRRHVDAPQAGDLSVDREG